MPPNPSSPRVRLRTTSRRVPRVRSAGKTTDEPADYEPEPNMKLSRALAVVLLLHVVAIGGIIAFSLIKDHNPDHLTTGTAGATPAVAEPEDARVPAAMTRDVADGGPRPAIHVVRQGETLTRIANANGVSLEALIAANTSTAVGGIRPGQQLKLPEKVSTPAARPSSAGDAANAADPKTSAPDDADLAAVNPTPRSGTPPPKSTPRPHSTPDSGQTYTVGKGESPYTIAHKFKVSPEALLKLNAIDDPKKIKPGQKLHIPAKSAPTKPDAKSKLKA